MLYFLLGSVPGLLHRLRVVFKTFKSADIFPNKDRVPVGLVSNVVYKFQCEQCSNCYVGETRRHLSTRVKEHITGKPIPSEITRHVHSPHFDNFKILFRTKFTKIAESIGHIPRVLRPSHSTHFCVCTLKYLSYQCGFHTSNSTHAECLSEKKSVLRLHLFL